MPKPEIVMSSAFGMGFWIDEDGTFMSCPAFEFGSFDIDNAVPVEDWDDFPCILRIICGYSLNLCVCVR